MRRYLLGRDTTDGLKQSVAAREYMEGQKDATLYPMPDVRSKLGTAAERQRLQQAEDRLVAAEKENDDLRRQLEDHQIVQLREERPPEPKRKIKATVGFNKPETWWQWTKRVILRMP